MSIEEPLRTRLDEQFRDLLGELAPPPHGLLSRDADEVPNKVYAEKLTARDIVEMSSIAQVDHRGNTVSRFVPTKEGWLGLDMEKFPKFAALIERVCKQDGMRERVSREFLESSSFAWMLSVRNGELDSSSSAVEFVERQAQEAIYPQRFWFPVDHLRIPAAFTVGRCTIRNFPDVFLDSWEEGWKKHLPERAEEIERTMKKKRRKYQGKACVTVEVEAERSMALKLAKERADDALMALRVFSPPAYVPEMASYLGRTGTVLVPGTEVFLESARGNSDLSMTDERRRLDWPIKSIHVGQLYGAGLGDASKLVMLEESERSELQNRCFTSLQLLDKSIRSNDLLDKTVFALAAAEALVLKDGSEPILGPASLRLAVMAAGGKAGRLKVIETVKDAHKIRGAYLHHGTRKEDIECIRELVNLVRTALLHAMNWCEDFQTRKDMTDHIDSVLLSGEGEPPPKRSGTPED